MATADRTGEACDADVLIVGAGVAGLTCATYTARADLETVVVDGGPSILERNAHLENVPGFPGGVDARRFLRACREQATDAGAAIREGYVTDCVRVGAAGPADGVATESVEGDGTDSADGDGPASAGGDDAESSGEAAPLRVETEDGTLRDVAAGDAFLAERVVAASWSDASYLDGLGVETSDCGSKTYVEVGSEGRTSVDDVYAAGRIAALPHQVAVVAGHGATVGLAAIRDADVDFFYDWVAPEGYFTGRGRDVPPGCEEIDDEERLERESRSRERMRDLLDGPPEPPQTHPSVEADED